MNWKSVLNSNNFYEVSDAGLVRSTDRLITAADGQVRQMKGRLIKPQYSKKGYAKVGIHQFGKRKHICVHLLVLEAFVSIRPIGLIACHADGNPANNNLENLRWDTSSRNQLDSVMHNTHPQTRKTHCKYGHLYSEENTLRYGDGLRRMCLKCQKARKR